MSACLPARLPAWLPNLIARQPSFSPPAPPGHSCCDTRLRAPSMPLLSDPSFLIPPNPQDTRLSHASTSPLPLFFPPQPYTSTCTPPGCALAPSFLFSFHTVDIMTRHQPACLDCSAPPPAASTVYLPAWQTSVFAPQRHELLFSTLCFYLFSSASLECVSIAL